MGINMKPQDMIYNEVLKRCLAEKVGDRIAKDAAVKALAMWKKGQFTKVGALINGQVTAAKKLKAKGKR